MLLVHIGDLHGLSDVYRACVRFLDAHDEPEQRGLAGAVRADHAHDSRRRKGERKMLEENLVPVGLGHILELDDLVAEARSVRNVYFQIGLLLLGIGRGQFLVGSKTGFLLGLTGLGSHPHPLQLVLEGLAPLALLLLLHLQPLGLLLQP